MMNKFIHLKLYQKVFNQLSMKTKWKSRNTDSNNLAISKGWIDNRIRVIFDDIRIKTNQIMLLMDHFNIVPAQNQPVIAGSILFSKVDSSSNGSDKRSSTNDDDDDEECICQCQELHDEINRIENERKNEEQKLRSISKSNKTEDEYAFLHDSSGHAEILALAYHFLNNRRPSFIQITNSLRICPACHEVMKRVAKLRQCEIILRDPNRVHHFDKTGRCSCNDFF